MSVAELMDELKRFRPELTVLVRTDCDWDERRHETKLFDVVRDSIGRGKQVVVIRADAS